MPYMRDVSSTNTLYRMVRAFHLDAFMHLTMHRSYNPASGLPIDRALSEFITVMIANNKRKEQIDEEMKERTCIHACFHSLQNHPT